MISLHPFDPTDMIGFVVQPHQMAEVEVEAIEDYAVLVVRAGGEAVTVRNCAGQPIMFAGVVPSSPKLGMAWALLSADAGPDMLAATRATAYFLETHPCTTICTPVNVAVPQFVRWAKMLGFEDRGMVQWQRDPNQHLFVKDYD